MEYRNLTHIQEVMFHETNWSRIYKTELGQILFSYCWFSEKRFVGDMKVQILEKVYSSGRPTLSTSLRGVREIHWIKKLGTAEPYDLKKGVGTLSYTSCKKTNISELFNKHSRRKRSHGKMHYKKKSPRPESSMNTHVDLMEWI